MVKRKPEVRKFSGAWYVLGPGFIINRAFGLWREAVEYAISHKF